MIDLWFHIILLSDYTVAHFMAYFAISDRIFSSVLKTGPLWVWNLNGILKKRDPLDKKNIFINLLPLLEPLTFIFNWTKALRPYCPVQGIKIGKYIQMMKNKFPIKSATFHLPSRETQTNNKCFRNFNCTICNACPFWSTPNFLVIIFVKIWHGTPWQILIAWSHPQMSNYLNKIITWNVFTRCFFNRTLSIYTVPRPCLSWVVL